MAEKPAAKVKRRKPAAKRLSEQLRIRATPDLAERIRGLAERDGITVSAWLVQRIMKAVREAEAERGARP